MSTPSDPWYSERPSGYDAVHHPSPNEPWGTPRPASELRNPFAPPEAFQSAPVQPSTGYPAGADGYARMTALKRLRSYRPNIIKKTLAILPLVFTVLLLLGMLMGLGDYTGMDFFREIIGGAFILAGFALPGAYWLVRNRRDSETVSAWLAARGTGEPLGVVLKKDYQALMNDPVAPPLLDKRRWGLIIVLMFFSFVIGGTIVRPKAAP